jgi:ssDNA-binding Zn-finger/Zn-ribbon topoisomerase 1
MQNRKNAGKEFWDYTGYPECSEIKNVEEAV